MTTLNGGPVMASPASEAMTRDVAQSLIKDIWAVTGYRAELGRLPVGPPSGPVWTVIAVHLVTGTTQTLKTPAAWHAFREATRQEVRAVVRTNETAERPAAESVVAKPVPADAAPAPARTITGVGSGAPFDFARWKASTELALRHVEADEERLRSRLVEVEQELARARQETALAIAARQQEAKLLRKALGVVDGQKPPAKASSRPTSKQGRAPSPAVRECTERILGYAGLHPDGFRVSACQREAGVPDGSTGYLAFKFLRDTGALVKGPDGLYRAAPRGTTAEAAG